MDVSKLGALFPKPVAAPSNGQSLGQVYKHIWLGSNLKKIMLPNSIWLRSGKPTYTKIAVFFADRSKGGPLFKKFGCKFCIVQRAEIVLKGGFRVISGPWNIP